LDDDGSPGFIVSTSLAEREIGHALKWPNNF
jgi:hypothetical protein